MSVVALRPVEDSDLDALFDQMRDPESVLMAAFTAEDPDDRGFVLEGQTEITYWIERAAWGKGIATRAVALLLDLVPTRPLHARAASDNAGSLRVLQKSGFKIIGTETSFAAARKGEIEETILCLD